MPVDLAALIDPARTAVVFQECQNAVLGRDSVLPALAEVAGPAIIPNLGRLAHAARAAGAPVFHAIAMRRDDGGGANANARLFAAAARSTAPMAPGSSGVEPIPEIGFDERDYLVPRLHGLGPINGTELEPLLRNLGITTVVAAGVSLNIGVLDLVFDAVNAGYQCVVPRDAVAGVPLEYGEAVIDNTLSVVATLCVTDDIVGAWAAFRA
jgi:nicotinamidase-related amidase